MAERRSRPLLFYSAWPLGYHNQEAELKALALADHGYEVLYVAGIGTRNPRLSSMRKLLDRARRKITVLAKPSESPRSGLREGSLLVLPPRQLRPVRHLNTAWVERQLLRSSARWDEAVAWVRWPTQELVSALRRLSPAAIVYECVDGYRHTPGMTGRWVSVFERAERDLVAQAHMVVVPNEPLADRFRAWGADVRLLPHGVDLPSEHEPSHDGAVTVGFVGTLDYRLEVPVLRLIAERHPEWRLRLIGPIQEGFDAAAFSDLPNVSLEPPVPYREVGRVLAGFDAGILPYVDDQNYVHMSPVKNLELLAAGKPAVARPTTALEPFADLLAFASSPGEFVDQLERSIAEDNPDLARKRKRVAAANTWDRRLAELCQLADEAVVRGARPTSGSARSSVGTDPASESQPNGLA